ncbi:hypothetical protein ES703_117318 [subsurface metagenome]
MDVFNQTSFLKHCIHFVWGFDKVNGFDFAYHLGDFGPTGRSEVAARLKIAGNAAAQVLGFADVKDLIFRALHKVKAGACWKAFYLPANRLEFIFGFG